MNHQQVLKYIKASAITPVGTPQFNKWLQQADFFEFLQTKELKELLSKYGSYKAHYRELLGRCVDAVSTLIALINKNYLDIK